MTAVTGDNDQLVLTLIKLIGAPKNVRSFTYRSAVGEVTKVTIEYFPDLNDPNVQELAAVVQEYRLVKIEPWPFAHQVIQRQVDKAELIERQYAHFTNPISGLKGK